MIYRHMPPEEHFSWLQRAGLHEATARFATALDVSIAHGDLETSGHDLEQLLGRPATLLTATAAHDADVQACLAKRT